MSASEVAGLLSGEVVTLSHIRRAVHHLPKSCRAALYDEAHPLHPSAVGEFFEALRMSINFHANAKNTQIISLLSHDRALTHYTTLALVKT